MDTDHSRKSKSLRSVGMAGAVLLLALLFSCGSGRIRAYADSSPQKEIFRDLTEDAILNPAAACGIMGNMMAESNFISNIVGLGNAYGLCQWTGPRMTRLQNFCASQKLDSTSAKGQVAFLLYEMETYYPRVFSYLQNVPNSAQGAYDAAYYFCLYFEAPAGGASAAAYRGSIARNSMWPAYGANALYLSQASGSKHINLRWSGKWSGSLAVMRSNKKDGKYKKIATIKKKVYTYTDKTIKKKKKYYYYLLPISGKKKRKDDRSNVVGGMSVRSMQDAECVITLSRTSYVYNGKARRPSVKVRYNGKKLKKNKHYHVSYSKNINAGTGVVTVRGTGGYTGSKRIKFKIKKAPMKVWVKNIALTWSKKKVIPVVHVKGMSRRKLSYRLKAVDPKIAKASGRKISLRKAGVTKIKVIVKGMSNYKGTVAQFKLTVKPAAPQITKGVRQGKKITVKWNCGGKPAGYEVMYTSRKGFGKDSTVIELKGSKSCKVHFEIADKKKTWQVRVRSYTIRANGQKMRSKWSKTVRIK